MYKPVSSQSGNRDNKRLINGSGMPAPAAGGFVWFGTSYRGVVWSRLSTGCWDYI
jgi:hypothetical protein